MTQTTVTRQQLVEALTDYCYFDDGDKLTAHQDGTFTLKFKDGLRNRVRQPKIETVLSYNIDGFNYVRLDYGVNKSPNGGFVHTIKFMFTPVVIAPVQADEAEVIEAETTVTLSDLGELKAGMLLSASDGKWHRVMTVTAREAVRELVELGYAESKTHKSNASYRITDAGRDYLRQTDAGQDVSAITIEDSSLDEILAMSYKVESNYNSWHSQVEETQEAFECALFVKEAVPLLRAMWASMGTVNESGALAITVNSDLYEKLRTIMGQKQQA